MIKLVRHISVVLLACMVFLLTIGATISQMHCEDRASLYFGSEASHCNDIKEIDCDIEAISCCSKEVKEKSCCSLLEDGCPRDSELLQFSFETTICDQLKVEGCKELTLLSSITSNDFAPYGLDYLFLIKDYSPPPLLTKPILSNIQFFLL